MFWYSYFNTFSYNDAIEAKKARQSAKKGYGPKEVKVHLTKKQEETIWVGLVNHLEQHDKLPIIAFTLSRDRCDQNSRSLTSVDLTTKSEKNFIRKFFDRSIQNLKQPDRLLPQVYFIFI
jgi:antiviral helicase SKI2